MAESRTRRLSIEPFLATVGGALGTLEPWVTARLAANLEEQDAAPGDPIFTAGDPPDHFFFLRQGQVDLVRDGKTTETVAGPTALGMLDALQERPRSHSARARTPLSLLRVRVDPWLELLEDSFELAQMAVRRLARNVAALEEERWATSADPPRETPLFVESHAARLDVVDRVAVLMQASLLRGAGAQPISDLAALSDDVSFAPGEALFTRGAPTERVFVLFDGRVTATRDAPHVTWSGGPGQVVCGTASFAGKARDWEASAVTPTRALVFAVEDWLDVMEENFEMLRATLASLARAHERLRETP